jgi:two-component system, cell cycle sensor histidine kinase and response regulator CckA
LFLIGATYLTAKYISSRIDKSLATFSSFFKKAAEESTEIDLRGVNFLEFEALALSANSMINKRELAERSLKENIAERERLEAQLRQAQKMEAIGTLAGGIAHDFNNVLLPIMGHAEMLMMGLPSDSHIQYNLQQIYKAGNRAKDMVRQILAFSRKDRQEKNRVRLGQIIADAVSLLRGSLPATIDIRYDIKTGEDTILANPTQIHQVILNLCTNASYAMREKGGKLRIELDDLVLRDSGNMFPHAAAGRYLRLAVMDSGRGIEHDIMGKIFEPYFTTKGPGEGTGMGLAVVHGIVLDHKGDIAVESEPGEGSTFTVLLPGYNPMEDQNDPDIKSPEEIKKGDEKILLVDDEKIVVDVLKTMLENLGYQVTAHTSSIEAFEAFRNNPFKYDLIITDMTMPNMTGKDLAAEVLAINPNMPTILCTGFSERIDEESARAMGIKAFIMKPVVIKQLASTVREVLDRDKSFSRN